VHTQNHVGFHACVAKTSMGSPLFPSFGDILELWILFIARAYERRL